MVDLARFEGENVEPDRVVVDEYGTAVSPENAKKRYGIDWRVIFIRNDGWSLGAPLFLERVAYEMWKDQWVAFWRCSSGKVQPISEYRPIA